MLRRLQPQLLAHDGHQQVGARADGSLDPHSAFQSTEERLHAKILLDPFEEELDLPAHLVRPADCQLRKIGMVGTEYEPLADLWVLEANATQRIRIALFGIEGVQRDRVVTDQPGAAIGTPRESPEAHASLRWRTYYDRCHCAGPCGFPERQLRRMSSQQLMHRRESLELVLPVIARNAAAEGVRGLKQLGENQLETSQISAPNGAPISPDVASSSIR